MDYYEWVESQRGASEPVTTWDALPDEPISDASVSSHQGTTRKTWVGDGLVLARIVLQGGSRGKPHRHPAEQVALVTRGALRLTMNGKTHIAGVGSIVHIPGNVMHLVEILDEETELVDIFVFHDSVNNMKKSY